MILEFALQVLARGFPLRGDPTFTLQPVQRGVERAVLDLENVVRGLLNVFGDLVTVGRTKQQGAED